ncbi:hypothetical protein CN380_07990 [Bacillus sp. AFS017274]|nr:hypothetical protein CN380_07990 [Bacillus sp. AFS017274]
MFQKFLRLILFSTYDVIISSLRSGTATWPEYLFIWFIVYGNQLSRNRKNNVKNDAIESARTKLDKIVFWPNNIKVV